MDWKLELVVVPVTDVDRAKAFYADQLGFVVDLDHSPSENVRIIQLTPPGSGCSIMIGKGVAEGVPGLAQGPPDLRRRHRGGPRPAGRARRRLHAGPEHGPGRLAGRQGR